MSTRLTRDRHVLGELARAPDAYFGHQHSSLEDLRDGLVLCCRARVMPSLAQQSQVLLVAVMSRADVDPSQSIHCSRL